MKSNKIYKALFILMITIPATYIVIYETLKLYKLTFTNFTISITEIVMLIISIIIAIWSYGNKHKSEKSTKIKRISKWGMFLGILNAVIMSLDLSVGQIFMDPEHFVEKDGKPMVAHVNAYLSIYVDYYDKKNIFIRGTIVKINEYIGKGGYDPFDENGNAPKAKRATYYDDNGNYVKTIE